ncbi:hypothetical protein L1987_42473 [Smallanthus sonchifolius]|uniref:Uncharacterized protein n=1 Tax=Smallanthus sonchifolius TaxID=185202 RepID=A0ACB9GK21_9ASTR|nr:hypothetical protein L1987_42473 [Smallanthus sonchifolius]
MHMRIEQSFFLMNKTGAPQGDELGLMNPFSNKSSKCFYNSAISVGANLYGASAIGAVPGTRLILNSTSLSGGIPGSLFGKTSENLATTDTSSIFFLVSVVTDTRYAKHPFRKYFAAFNTETIPTELDNLSRCIVMILPCGERSSMAFLSHKIRAWLEANQSIPRKMSKPAKVIGNSCAGITCPDSVILQSFRTS